MSLDDGGDKKKYVKGAMSCQTVFTAVKSIGEMLRQKYTDKNIWGYTGKEKIVLEVWEEVPEGSVRKGRKRSKGKEGNVPGPL
jgi:hypothetical protein